MVVDASVWVSALLPDEIRHRQSRRWLDSTLGEESLSVPVLLLAEVAGAVMRRSGSTDASRQAVQKVLDAARLSVVELDYELGLAASRLAGELGLRGADAIYVAVASSLRVPLVTWDREIRARAANVVRVFPPASQ